MLENLNESVIKPQREPAVRSTAQLLITVGLLQLAYGQWTSQPGQIKLDVAWLLVGLALYFGNAKIVSAVRWLALLAVVPAIVVPVQQALLPPTDLIITQFRLYPGQVIVFFMPLIISAVLASILAWRLNSEPVKAVLRACGRIPASPLVPVALGLVLILGATVFLRYTLRSPDAARAVEIATKQFGTKYKYFTNRVNVVSNHGTTVYATVQMWNEKEALQVPVKWSR